MLPVECDGGSASQRRRRFTRPEDGAARRCVARRSAWSRRTVAIEAYVPRASRIASGPAPHRAHPPSRVDPVPRYWSYHAAGPMRQLQHNMSRPSGVLRTSRAAISLGWSPERARLLLASCLPVRCEHTPAKIMIREARRCRHDSFGELHRGSVDSVYLIYNEFNTSCSRCHIEPS